MLKKIKILILLVIAVFSFCLLRDFLVKSLIGTIASRVTGAPVRVGGLSLSVIRQSIKISGLRVYNPKGFPRDILVDIPKMGAVCDFAAIFTGKIHLKQVDFELKEIGMAKNKEGKLNVDSLKMIGEEPAPEMPIQIDLVNLAIGRVVSKDYSVTGPPVVKVYDVNLTKSYKNITSLQKLAALIVSEPLKAAGIQGLKIYAVSILTGVAALPVAAVLTFAGKDHAQVSFPVPLDKVYAAGLKTLQVMGKVKKENPAAGVISAEINGAGVVIKLGKIDSKTTQVTVSARKFLLPKPEIASGVIYQISDELK